MKTPICGFRESQATFVSVQDHHSGVSLLIYLSAGKLS